MRGNGGIIGGIQKNVPTTESASGVWSLREVTSAIKSGIWPAQSVVSTYSITHVTSASNGTDGTSFTFTSQSLGGTDTNDVIVVVAGGEESATTSGLTQISSITVDGSSATSQVQAVTPTSGAVQHICGIFAVTGVSSSSGNVVVTFDALMKRCAISIYRISGTSGTLPSTSTDSVTVENSTATAALSTTVSAGSVTIAGIYTDAGSSTITSSNGDFTEDVENTGVETTDGSFATYSATSGASPISTTLTASVTPDELAAVMCTFLA